jgi:hypothetical protein
MSRDRRPLRFLALSLLACAGCFGSPGQTSPGAPEGQTDQDARLAEIVASSTSPRDIHKKLAELEKRDRNLSKTKTLKKRKGR